MTLTSEREQVKNSKKGEKMSRKPGNNQEECSENYEVHLFLNFGKFVDCKLKKRKFLNEFLCWLTCKLKKQNF